MQDDRGEVIEEFRGEVVPAQLSPDPASREERLRPGGRILLEHRACLRAPGCRQLSEGPDRLGWPRLEGRLLPQPDHHSRGRLPTMPVDVGSDQLLLPPLDPGTVRATGRAGGERSQQCLRDSGDLVPGVPVPATIDSDPLDAEVAVQTIHQHRVVRLGQRDGRLMERVAEERAPHPVGSLDVVRDHNVGVQLRIAGAGVVVIERCCNDTVHGYPSDARSELEHCSHPTAGDAEHLKELVPERVLLGAFAALTCPRRHEPLRVGPDVRQRGGE